MNHILYIEQFSCSYPLKGPSDVIRPPVFGYPQNRFAKIPLSIAVLAVSFPRHFTGALDKLLYYLVFGLSQQFLHLSRLHVRETFSKIE